MLRIGLVGDHDPSVTAHRAIPAALGLAGEKLGIAVDPVWLATDSLPADPASSRRLLDGFDAIWCVPASPYRHTGGALAAITTARTRDIPFFGSCGGFQHALLEIARNRLRLDAAHAELDPAAEQPVIAALSCSLVEVSGAVRFTPGSMLARAYGSDRAEEGYHCSYGLNPAFESHLAAAGVTVTARDQAGDARAFALDGPRFFHGTLFQAERRALRGEPSPPAVALLEAALAARTDGIRMVEAAADELPAVRALFADYAAGLGVDLDFQDFDAELAGLPGGYAPPHGALFLLTVHGQPAGCVAVRRLQDGIAEMKRLFIRPEHRRARQGRRLAVAAIGAARAAGHRAMRLDTLPGMDQAQALYAELGFREIPAYRHNPVAGARFLELRL